MATIDLTETEKTFRGKTGGVMLRSRKPCFFSTPTPQRRIIGNRIALDGQLGRFSQFNGIALTHRMAHVVDMLDRARKAALEIGPKRMSQMGGQTLPSSGYQAVSTGRFARVLGGGAAARAGAPRWYMMPTADLPRSAHSTRRNSMHVLVNGVRLFVDVANAWLVPDGDRMREKPALLMLHGGPGFDHVLFKDAFSALSEVAQVIFYDHRGNGRSERDDPQDVLSIE